MLIILALAKLKQDGEFKASLGYTANSKPAWIKMRPSQKSKKKKKIVQKVCFSENVSSVQDNAAIMKRREMSWSLGACMSGVGAL